MIVTIPHPQTADSRIDDMLAALKEAGLRLTPQRRAICRILAASREHPTAQALYDQLLPDFPSLSRATVYNTLGTLTEVGLVSEIGAAGDGAIHYDSDLSPHAHLVCLRCHHIEDFVDESLTRLTHRLTEDSGYQLHDVRIVYYGLCPHCQKDG